MAEYKLFYFVGSRLEASEAFEASDHVAAINRLCGRATDRTVEIWDGDTKVAVLGPAKHSVARGMTLRGRNPKPRRP